MQLIFSALLLCLFLGVSIGFRFWIRKRREQSLSINTLEAAICAFLMGALILGLAVCNILFSQPNLVLYTCIVSSLFAVVYAEILWPRRKILWIPIVCGLSVYLIHKAFPTISIDLCSYLLMAGVWLSVMSMFIYFDRLPFVSFIMTATWAISFSVIQLIGNLVPVSVVVLPLLVFTPFWALMNILGQHQQVVLGQYASVLVGYIVGGVAACCVVFGSYASIVALTGYYLFELILIGCLCFGLHPLGMCKGDYALSHVLKQGNTSAVFKIVFSHQLLLSLLAVLMWQTQNFSILILGIVVILIDLYNSLKNIGMPAPSIKQLWNDTKTDIKTLFAVRQQANSEPQTMENAHISVSKKSKPHFSNKKQHRKKKI